MTQILKTFFFITIVFFTNAVWAQDLIMPRIEKALSDGHCERAEGLYEAWQRANAGITRSDIRTRIDSCFVNFYRQESETPVQLLAQERIQQEQPQPSQPSLRFIAGVGNGVVAGKGMGFYGELGVNFNDNFGLGVTGGWGLMDNNPFYHWQSGLISTDLLSHWSVGLKANFAKWFFVSGQYGTVVNKEIPLSPRVDDYFTSSSERMMYGFSALVGFDHVFRRWFHVTAGVGGSVYFEDNKPTFIPAWNVGIGVSLGDLFRRF